MDIDKMLEIELLYSQYSSLLTEKQREIVDMYYEENYSLGEISQILNISRQSVHDSLKRSELALRDYEDKVGVISKMAQIESLVQKLENILFSNNLSVNDRIENDVDVNSENSADNSTQLKLIIGEIKELI